MWTSQAAHLVHYLQTHGGFESNERTHGPTWTALQPWLIPALAPRGLFLGPIMFFFFPSPRVETTFNYLFMSREKDDCANKMDKWETPNQLNNCIKSAGKRQKPVLCLLINVQCIHGIYKLYKKLEKREIVIQFYFIHTTMLFYKQFFRLIYRFDIEQVRLLS